MTTNTNRSRIFISYKREVVPDEPLAMQIFQELRPNHDVFIDQTITVGTRWAQRIEDELSRSDFLIVMLSADSVNSEMVQMEITLAHQLSKAQNGRPQILPVRLNYRDPFPYPINAYLDPIEWAFWRGDEDTARLIDELRQAVAGGTLSISDEQKKVSVTESARLQQILPPPFTQAQPTQTILLETPEGTMDPHSRFYVERVSDPVALQVIKREGVTITIKAPRQMGKSSLLLRTIDTAAKQGKRVIFFDFQQFDRSTLQDANSFFQQFCVWLTFKLKLEDRSDAYWKLPLGNVQRCSSYFEDYVLKNVDRQIVLAMDEVECMFDTDFRNDFFAMLRSWHNSRQDDSPWKRLDLALVTSTEPYQFIEDLNQSPFNVGEVLELTDFTLHHIAELNRRHGSPLGQNEERKLMDLVGGQPYLVRRALYLVANKRLTVAELFSRAIDHRGPFGDHLRNHLFRLHRNDDLVQGLRKVIRDGVCPDKRIFFRLRGAGLVHEVDRMVVPRCQLYADYFREHLDG